jgi:hypothetical protein
MVAIFGGLRVEIARRQGVLPKVAILGFFVGSPTCAK